MRDSRSFVSLRTYALAFAVVLTPAFMQTQYTCNSGDTRLASLELEVSGVNRIVFDSALRVYDLWLPGGETQATVRAVPMDPLARVTWYVPDGAGMLASGVIGLGGGEVTIDLPPDGYAVYIGVLPPERAVNTYIVNMSPVCPQGDACANGGLRGTCSSGTCVPAAFPCTEQGIRVAIAAGGGPHTFECDGPTVVTTQAEIVIDNDVVLDGEGNLIVDAGGTHRVLSVPEGVTAELIGFTLTGGSTTNYGGGVANLGRLTISQSTVSGNSASHGGGLHNAFPGSLTVANTTVSNNAVTRFGGGIYNHNDAFAEVIDTTVSNNVAMTAAGGISNRPGATMTIAGGIVQGNSAEARGAGGVQNAGIMIMSDATVSSNSAPGDGGGILNEGALTSTECTISGNVADRGGGVSNSGQATLTNNTVSSNSAVDWDGGGILNLETGTLTVVGGTVSENTAVFGAGIRNWNQAQVTDVTVSDNIATNAGGGFSNRLEGATMTITGCTVVGNIAETGGSGGIGNTGTLTVINTTVSGNQSALSGAAIGSGDPAWPLRLVSSTLFGNVTPPGHSVVFSRGSFTATNSIIEGQCQVSHVVSLGGNIESPGNTCLVAHSTDQVFVTPEQLNLGPLQDNGGPTMTHALLPGSVAIDVIPADMCEVTEDQRGFPRDSMCDVGAFEVQP